MSTHPSLSSQEAPATRGPCALSLVAPYPPSFPISGSSQPRDNPRCPIRPPDTSILCCTPHPGLPRGGVPGSALQTHTLLGLVQTL